MNPRLKHGGLIVLVLMLAGAIAWYLWYLQAGRYRQSTNDATIAADQVTIAAKLAGTVSTVAVEDNQSVARGALLVGIIIGLIELFSGATLPEGFKDTMPYIVLLIVLAVRPQGLFGKLGRKKV